MGTNYLCGLKVNVWHFSTSLTNMLVPWFRDIRYTSRGFPNICHLRSFYRYSICFDTKDIKRPKVKETEKWIKAKFNVWSKIKRTKQLAFNRTTSTLAHYFGYFDHKLYDFCPNYVACEISQANFFKSYYSFLYKNRKGRIKNLFILDLT